jgi:two-component system chemotaxis sensor kinase CheA
MRQQVLQAFLEKAEDRLSGIRGSLLLFLQGRLASSEVVPVCHGLVQLQFEAEGSGLTTIGRFAAEAAYSIEHATSCGPGVRDAAVNASLDLISKLEAELLQMPIGSAEFLTEAEDLVESTFDDMIAHRETRHPLIEDFEIDDETLEIFREEAGELIENIKTGLATLRSCPEGTEALWDIRRNAHTLKGAAGIVGLDLASKLSHKLEDLLDKRVVAGRPLDAQAIEVLEKAANILGAMSNGGPHDTGEITSELDALIAVPLEAPSPTKAEPSQRETSAIHTPPTPVVRVSLDRLDQLLYIASALVNESEAVLKRIAEGTPGPELAELVRGHRAMAVEISDGLKKVRMVRFGVLEMRLNRTVQMTCQDEGKAVNLVILDPDVEIDTLVIDAMIEPLLHLLKNAVVHGIEQAETRRLLGKTETGTVAIGVASDGRNVTLTVEDDGRGISTTKLLAKGVETGLIQELDAERMDDNGAYALIFERGLTTTNTVNMNAGRGVGMSIVKESVESRGGKVNIVSAPQQGTRFTLSFPIIPEVREPAIDDPGQPLILIVDDSNSIRRMSAKIVESAGCRAVTAINGADALTLIRERSLVPDLILSDVEMPTMDGWQFLDHVKTDAKLAAIPVVMVTSLTSEESRAKAAKLGASDYFVKPFTADHLRSVMSTLVV